MFRRRSALSGCFDGSHGFPATPGNFPTVSMIRNDFQRFARIFDDSEDLQGFRCFAKISKFIRTSIIPDCFDRSRRFRDHAAISKGFHDFQEFPRIPNDFHGFQWFSEDSQRFQIFPMISNDFQGFQGPPRIPEYFKGFQGFMDICKLDPQGH